MLYLIAYDIPHDRRRTKIHKVLCGFGQWTQYSFFECYLTEEQLILLRHRLRELIKETEDNVRLYPLCAACEKHVETFGSPPPKEDKVYLL